jgi:hypothetical protein
MNLTKAAQALELRRLSQCSTDENGRMRAEARVTPTADEAKQFFIEKIVAEAERQAVSLSANERAMLNWSEVEPGCVADPELAEALAREISDDDYEAKISRLLVGAYEHDLGADGAAKDAYRRAYSVLKNGDYYLLVMIDHALGRRLRRWWQFSMS